MIGSTKLPSLVDLKLTAAQIADAQEVFAQQHPIWKLNQLKLLRPASDGYFRLRISGYAIGEIGSAFLHSDAVTGSYGGNADDAPVVMQMIDSGGMIFESDSQVLEARPGQAALRYASERWQVRCKESTKSRYVTIPRSLISPNLIRRLTKRACLFDANSAELKFILAFLELVDAQRNTDESDRRDTLAQDGIAALISGIIRNDSTHTSSEFTLVTVERARQIMDRSLLDENLSPAKIAWDLSISVRSLHRAFAQIGSTVMSEIRGRRLHGAHEDLMANNRASSISSIAAKWQFSDSSHFVRSFKAEYGQTPASYVRRKTSSAT